MMAGLLTAVLFSVALQTLQALALNCVCDYSHDACTNDSCRVDFMFHQVHCDVAVGVYLNGTIKSVVHSCIDDFVHNECRTHPSPSDDGTFYTYYACCNDRDYCNKCIIPKELPDAAYRMMGSWLDLDCNFTLPQPSLSLSLTHTLLDLPSTATPSPPGDSLSLSKPQVYAMAGMLGLVCVCLVVAVVVIVYVWCKRNERHKTASLGSLPTFEDDLLETTNITSGSGSGQRLLEQRTIARQIKKIEIVGMWCRHRLHI
jgi:hypothetical protein